MQLAAALPQDPVQCRRFVAAGDGLAYRARGMHTPYQQVTELRRAIDGLPSRTREAMLEGMSRNSVITGAYTDPHGGVCPMLAAHRQGARADFVAFAGAWDRFTGVDGRSICRRATQREIGALVAQLEESLQSGGPPSDLTAAIAEHKALARARYVEVPRSDLAAAIAEHQSLARARREREASGVGLDWLHGGDDAPLAPIPPVPRVRRSGPIPPAPLPRRSGPPAPVPLPRRSAVLA